MTTFGQNAVFRFWVHLLSVLSNLHLPPAGTTGINLIWILQASAALIIFGAASGVAAGLYVAGRATVVRKLTPPTH
jgi:hypothetical protein